MSLAAHDVVLVELPVVGDGLREALHGVRDALLEAPAPKLHLLLVAIRLRHRTRSGGGRDGRKRGTAAPEGNATWGGEAAAGEGGGCPED